MFTACFHSPFGCFEIKTTDTHLTSLRLLPQGELPPEDYQNGPDIMLETVRQMGEYFHRQRTEFDLPLDFSAGTVFHQSVWRALQEIPYGRTCSYSDIAQKIGNPEAVRAVGLANRSNPLPIVVPCHRVNAKDGDLHGYYYGLEMKRKLLELENPMSYGEQGSLF